jgi:hypothetical protein
MTFMRKIEYAFVDMRLSLPFLKRHSHDPGVQT